MRKPKNLKKYPTLFSNYLVTSKQIGTWKSIFFGLLRISELYFVLNWEKDAQVTWCSLILRILQQSHMRAHNSQGIEGLLFGGHNGWFWGQLLPYLVKVDATKAAIIIVYDATFQWCRNRGARGAPAPPPIFGRSVNPILTGGGQIMPTNYHWPPKVFYLPASLLNRLFILTPQISCQSISYRTLGDQANVTIK